MLFFLSYRKSNFLYDVIQNKDLYGGVRNMDMHAR